MTPVAQMHPSWVSLECMECGLDYCLPAILVPPHCMCGGALMVVASCTVSVVGEPATLMECPRCGAWGDPSTGEHCMCPPDLTRLGH